MTHVYGLFRERFKEQSLCQLRLELELVCGCYKCCNMVLQGWINLLLFGCMWKYLREEFGKVFGIACVC